jgi:hypothetical protein
VSHGQSKAFWHGRRRTLAPRRVGLQSFAFVVLRPLEADPLVLGPLSPPFRCRPFLERTFLIEPLVVGTLVGRTVGVGEPDISRAKHGNARSGSRSRCGWTVEPRLCAQPVQQIAVAGRRQRRVAVERRRPARTRSRQWRS